VRRLLSVSVRGTARVRRHDERVRAGGRSAARGGTAVCEEHAELPTRSTESGQISASRWFFLHALGAVDPLDRVARPRSRSRARRSSSVGYAATPPRWSTLDPPRRSCAARVGPTARSGGRSGVVTARLPGSPGRSRYWFDRDLAARGGLSAVFWVAKPRAGPARTSFLKSGPWNSLPDEVAAPARAPGSRCPARASNSASERA